MTTSLLSLPVDIPWKRLAISQDMYAPARDQDLPAKWHSSLAVFVYEPQPNPAVDDSDELTTFLKVEATITGYAPETGIIQLSDGTLFDLEDFIEKILGRPADEDVESLLDEYYPAYSALVQVAVFPNGQNPDPQSDGMWDTNQYPYLSDFEPKKRELLETTTETGETMTHSATDANVRKGGTTTNRSESGSPYYSYPFKTAGRDDEDVRTTDTLQENRQTNSHTTQLSHLFHLLDSYHVGTNRALFFINARPHLVVSDYTFVHGPRALEGIQEFFLVVRRPKQMPGICVKAVLETAHLFKSTTTTTTGGTTYDQQELVQPVALWADGGPLGGNGNEAHNTWTVGIPGGYMLDRSRGGGIYHLHVKGNSIIRDFDINLPAGVEIKQFDVETGDNYVSAAIPQFTLDPSDQSVQITASVHGWGGIGDTSAHLNGAVGVYIISRDPVTTPTTTTQDFVDLFITARDVSGCLSPDGIQILPAGPYMPYVAYEHVLDPSTTDSLQLAQGGGKEAVVAANAVSRQLRTAVINSFNSSARYVAGQVDFLHTHFAMRRMLSGIGPAALESRPGLRTAMEQVSPGQELPQSLPKLAARVSRAPLETRRTLLRALGIKSGDSRRVGVNPEQLSAPGSGPSSTEGRSQSQMKKGSRKKR